MGDCRFTSSRKVSITILSTFAFRNSAPISTSTADSAKFLSIWHRVNIDPLMCMGCLSFGFHPRKKCLAARIFASLADN